MYFIKPSSYIIHMVHPKWQNLLFKINMKKSNIIWSEGCWDIDKLSLSFIQNISIHSILSIHIAWNWNLRWFGNAVKATPRCYQLFEGLILKIILFRKSNLQNLLFVLLEGY